MGEEYCYVSPGALMLYLDLHRGRQQQLEGIIKSGSGNNGLKKMKRWVDLAAKKRSDPLHRVY